MVAYGRFDCIWFFTERDWSSYNIISGDILSSLSSFASYKNVNISKGNKIFQFKDSLRSWRDFVRECFCFGSEAVNASGEAVRGLVKSRVEFPPAQISGVF